MGSLHAGGPFPEIPYPAWRDTRDTLHRWAQVVGKIRLACAPPRNHWWHVPFHLTGRGITTRPMRAEGGDAVFTIDLDFVDHRLLVHTTTGRTSSFSLPGHSVASFHEAVFAALDDLGVGVTIANPVPFDLEDAVPFAEDDRPRAYDPGWVTRYWQVLSAVNLLLEEFAGGFSGKTSPVHHFWHTFDIAVTRFSDRAVDLPPGTDDVTREAYSREVVSFGFWFGDASMPEPAFYSYTAPEPDGIADEPLSPSAAAWSAGDNGHLAVLRYGDARAADDPRAAVLDFYESAYVAGAGRAGWDVERLRARGGRTGG